MDTAHYQHAQSSYADETMASVDHAWLRMGTAVSPMVINAVMTFKSPVKHAPFQQRVMERFVSISRFQCRAGSGLVGDRWQPCAIDSEYHFPIHSDHLDTDAELQHVATQFINQPLDDQRPLWRMLLIPGFQQGSALVLRIHHAYADGMALMKILLQLMDEGEMIRKFEQNQASASPPPAKNGWLQKLQPFLPGNGRWAETLSLVEELTTELLKMGLSPGEENVFKQPGLCGKKQLVWTPPLKLDEVKAIAKAQSAKVNDVLLSSATGAFRRYLKSIDQLTSWSELRTVVPVDLRSALKAPSLGNYFGLVFLSLPLSIEDPIERASVLKQRMQALKSSKQAWLVFQILQLSGYLPDIAEKELIRLFSSKASAVMTNVPGPAFPLHFIGSELDQILFWVPQSGSIGVGVSILTYNNRVQFGLMTDQQLIQTPQSIIECFNDEFEALLLETLMTLDWPT
ncbi:MAG: WS/DGAT domain-containing protein [Reinekea sp.]|nr:WS/DGAT domain-containing protein [Reinekea sp.]